MQNQGFRKTANSKGNALWFVLIAIGLLSALTLTLTRTGGDTAYNDEQAAIMASTMQRQAITIKNGIDELLSRGCSINEINFDQEIVTSYDNTGAPADDRCNLFHTNGLGLNWPVLAGDAFTGSAPRDRWRFTGANRIVGVGTDCANGPCNELLMTAEIGAGYANVCNKLNEAGGITSPPFPEDTDISSSSGVRWVGSFTGNTLVGDEANGTAMVGKKSACFYDSTDFYYVYYFVLYAQ